MGFGDLKTEAGLQSLNNYLVERSYIEGLVGIDNNIHKQTTLIGTLLY